MTATPYALPRLASGYRMLRWPDHPLASSIGTVSEHRAVFYAANGPGPHGCHWCARRLRFEPTPLPTRDDLVVDHLDGDKLNNTPANLVPACRPCNSGRAHRPDAYHAADSRTTPPHDREGVPREPART